jgi:hypothetical protein
MRGSRRAVMIGEDAVTILDASASSPSNVMTIQDNGPPAPYRFDLRHLLDDAADDG